MNAKGIGLDERKLLFGLCENNDVNDLTLVHPFNMILQIVQL